MQTLKKHVGRMVRKWRVHRLFSRVSIVVSKVFQGYKVRNNLLWALDKPLNLRENRYYVFLKEQKYLVKHIILT